MDPSDYTDPICPFDTRQWRDEPVVDAIDVGRVIGNLDQYLALDDLEGAEDHLQYWIATAQMGHDLSGELSLQNELMGLLRKKGDREGAFAAVQRAQDLLDELDMGCSLSGGTIILNCATVHESFGQHQQALELYQQAEVEYLHHRPPDDLRLAGLYNNMALAYGGLGSFGEAHQLLSRALQVLEGREEGLPDAALTHLNCADTFCAEKGMEEADGDISTCLGQARECLDRAWSLVQGPAGDLPFEPSYLAYVLGNCISGFQHYGWFLYAGELQERKDALHAGA